MTLLFPIVNGEQRVFIAFAVIFTIVPAFFVGLRILARRIANRRLGLSDWLMISASALLVVYQGVNISAVIVGGLGLHIDDIINEYGVSSGQETFIKHLLAMQCLWCTDLVLVKLAILTLYIRIFEIRTFIVLAHVTGVLIILWAITMIVGSVLICQPIAFYWDHTIKGGFCGDYYALWLTTGVLNIVTDLVVLLLPMPHLYGLSMATYKKVVLMGTFGMGLLTCVISAIRLWSLLRFQQADATYSTIPSALLSQLEPSLLITLGCVPLLRPLLGRKYSSRGTARYNTRLSSSGRMIVGETPANGSSGSKNKSRMLLESAAQRFKKLADESTESDTTQLRPETSRYSAQVDHALHHHHHRHLADVSAGGGGREDLEGGEHIREERAGEGSEGESIELRSIAVTKTWMVEEGPRA